MAQHSCSRCGFQSSCRHGGWPDRHPFAAVTAGLFTLTLMAMMFSVYPVAAWSMTALTAAALGVHAAVRERSRRAALAARADYEHAALVARSVPPSLSWPRQPLPRHLNRGWTAPRWAPMNDKSRPL